MSAAARQVAEEQLAGALAPDDVAHLEVDHTPPPPLSETERQTVEARLTSVLALDNVACARPADPSNPDARFVTWVKCLYADHTRVVRVNGFETEPLELASGCPQGDILAASCFGAGVEPLGRMFAAAGLRGVVTDDGEEFAFCRFADDLELIVHPDDLDKALDIMDVYCAGSGMCLNRSKTEGLWIGRRRSSTIPWTKAAYADAPPAERAAARLMWLRPGGSIRVLGVQVGDGIDADAEWQTIAGRMLTNMRRWTGTRLTYRARVLILQATVWSLPSFLAMYRTPPDGLLDRMYAASVYFLWKGRLPVRSTVDSPVRAYHCARRSSRATLALPRTHGGFAWSDPRLHIMAARATHKPRGGRQGRCHLSLALKIGEWLGTERVLRSVAEC